MGCEKLFGAGPEAFDLVVVHRLDEGLPRWEMAVERADPNPRFLGDRVERDSSVAGRKGSCGDGNQVLPVAAGLRDSGAWWI
jgi:hypothetical protein